MFYLLEDNRIIVDNKKFSHIFHYEDRKGFLYKTFEDRNNGKSRKIGKIKNQSNNVFDLVECCQDLIETKEGQFYKPLKLQTDSFVVKYDCCVLFNGIKAIYKPDDKGNYIKVWEEKYEKNEQR